MMTDLNPKQAAFVREYLVDLNGAQAAIRAGYSEAAAKEQASRLLTNANVQDAIAAGQADRADRTEVTADRVVRELSAMAFFDPGEIGSAPMNGPEDIALLPERVRRSIVGWSWDKAGNFTLKLAPKSTALDLLGRHLGMFKDRIDVTIQKSADEMTDAELDAAIMSAQSKKG